MNPIIRAARSADFFRWYDCFSRFAGVDSEPVSDTVALQVWQWIVQDRPELRALVAEEYNGPIIGAAHFRSVPVPRTARRTIVIDDLIVEDSPAGSELALALLAEIEKIAAAEGAHSVSWPETGIADVDALGEPAAVSTRILAV